MLDEVLGVSGRLVVNWKMSEDVKMKRSVEDVRMKGSSEDVKITGSSEDVKSTKISDDDVSMKSVGVTRVLSIVDDGAPVTVLLNPNHAIVSRVKP